MMLWNLPLHLLLTQQGCMALVAFNRGRPMAATFSSTTRIHAVAPDANDTNNMSIQDMEMMLDDAVLLYSNPSLQVQDDIKFYRKKEVQDLVEDIVFQKKGGRPQHFETEEEESDNDDDDDDVIVPSPLLKEEPQSITDLSQALDQIILGDYQPTFSEDEIDMWVRQINSVSTKLDSQLKSLPDAGGSLTTAITVSAETVQPPTSESLSLSSSVSKHNTASAIPQPTKASTKEQIETRLEQLTVLIDPLGESRIPTPLVGTQTEEDTVPRSTTPSTTTAAATETLANSKDSSSELSETNTVPKGAFFASLSDESADQDATENNTTTNDRSSTSADEWAAMALTSNATTLGSEAADVVSAVVSVAAIGAAAVTKLPIIAAGVAMGPIVSASVAYAKGRMSEASAES
ncbi:MAG: hypothetical protein SGILL_002452, partial [Bacillariaceae sp.]